MTSTDLNEGHSVKDYGLSDLTPHEPIIISSNEVFENYSFPGEGTPDNPYLIENLLIESTNQTPCIYMFNTTVSFIIRNCDLSGTTGSVYSAMHLLFIENGVVEDCAIHDAETGVTLAGSNNIIDSIHVSNCNYTGLRGLGSQTTIKNSIFYPGETQDTLLLEHANNFTLLNNTFHYQEEWFDTQIRIRLSNNTKLEDNTIISNSIPILITQESNCTYILNNLIQSSRKGIIIDSSLNTYISGGRFETTGLPGSSSGIDMEGAENVIVSDCLFQSSGVYSKEDTSGISISTSRFESCTFLLEDSLDIRIEDCEFVYTPVQLYLGTDETLVSNNTISDTITGIYLVGMNGIVRNNTIRDCGVGINAYPASSSYRIYYNTFINNEITAIDDGTDNIWDNGVNLGNYYLNSDPFPSDRWPVIMTQTPTGTGDFDIPMIVILIGGAAITMAIIAIVLVKLKRK